MPEPGVISEHSALYLRAQPAPTKTSSVGSQQLMSSEVAGASLILALIWISNLEAFSAQSNRLGRTEI